MRATFLVLCLLCATAAFGQSSAGGGAVLSNEPQSIGFISHAQRATTQQLGQTQNLLGDSSFTSAQGERPLWEVMPAPDAKPLGDTARLLKKQHENAKKAEIVWDN